VAHPHRVTPTLFPETVEQRAGLFDFHIGTAELRRMATFDDATQLGAERLLSVADAEDRHA
jgi:hypothetical protein